MIHGTLGAPQWPSTDRPTRQTFRMQDRLRVPSALGDAVLLSAVIWCVLALILH